MTKRLRPCLGGLLIACLALAPAPAAAQARVGADQIQAGYRLLFNGDKAGAVTHFDGLTKASPEDLAARFGWLMAERERRKREGLDPDGVAEQLRAQSQLLIGRILDLTNQRAQALKVYQRVVDDFPQQGGPVNAAKVGLITPYHRPTPAKPAGGS